MSEQTTPDGAESPIIVERQGRIGRSCAGTSGWRRLVQVAWTSSSHGFVLTGCWCASG